MNLTASLRAPVAAARTAAVAVIPRVLSVDVLRGVVMVLMAIDHVRVYSGVPAGGPTAGVFFTRWVTHFCAPVFVFLAGTSAFLYGRTSGDPAALSRYLFTRGLILVLLEMTIIRWSWTFSLASLLTFQLAGVIWMLGWCMVLMSALVRLPTSAIAVIGLAIMIGQDVLRAFNGIGPAPMQWLMQFLYFGGEVGPISILYSIVPWIGVMAAGYAFGAILLREPEQRDRALLLLGLSATAVFVVLAIVGVVVTDGGDGPPALFRALNQRKYPASQLFLLMTLGPAIALMPLFERARGPVTRMLATFGRVPMFYYLLHIVVIHALALGVWILRDGIAHNDWFVTAPYVSVPPEQQWSLPLLYLVFAIAVAVLYWPCRWYADTKARSRSRWLRYI
jgi:uncharacterized membrane protein